MKISTQHSFLYGKLFAFMGLILYRVALDYSYINIIFPRYGYQGFALNFSKLYIFISWLFLILLSPLIVKTFRRSNISSNILTVLVLVSLVPTTTLIAYSNSRSEYIYLSFLLKKSMVRFQAKSAAGLSNLGVVLL